MKTYFKIFLLSLSLFIMSCSDDMFTYNVDDEEQQTITEQIITGAGDCLTNKGWSWRNSEAVTINNTDTCEFSFKTTVAGKLSFSYCYDNDNIHSSDELGFLEIVINNKMYFKKDKGYTAYIAASIGSVKANEEVIFRGRNYRVEDIKIVGK